jgi:hypothetical protein
MAVGKANERSKARSARWHCIGGYAAFYILCKCFLGILTNMSSVATSLLPEGFSPLLGVTRGVETDLE